MITEGCVVILFPTDYHSLIQTFILSSRAGTQIIFLA